MSYQIRLNFQVSRDITGQILHSLDITDQTNSGKKKSYVSGLYYYIAQHNRWC